MSRAIVTHFDGDPFTLNAWLILYQAYWQGECDKVYATIYYNPDVVPKLIIDFDLKLLANFPEIKVITSGNSKPPEIGNQESLKTVKEDYIGLIESDGLVYGRGIVDQCFKLLENEGQDIVAPPWHLIDEPYIKGDLHSEGFMRCFTFVKKSILDKTDLDFMPRTIPAGTKLTEDYTTSKDNVLDCFGWLSWQLLLLTNKITYTPTNILTPDNILAPYSNFKWVHVRQMSSSAIGMGGGEYSLWANGNEQEIVSRVLRLFNEDFPDAAAEFTHIKAVAFKLLFWDMLREKVNLGHFAQDYRQLLETVMDYYNLPRERIYEIKGFYKALFNL